MNDSALPAVTRPEDSPAPNSPLVGNYLNTGSFSSGKMVQVNPSKETSEEAVFEDGVPPPPSAPIISEESRAKLHALINSKWWTGAVLLGIFAALFLADIAAAAHFDDDASDGVYITLCILLGLFCVELIINIIAIPKYLTSFFFVMDFLGTVSIIFDIPWITEPLGIDFTNGAVMRASKAARVGSRAGRMSKLVRVLRAVRVVRVLKVITNYFNKHKEDIGKKDEKESSKIGSTLSESISKEVAALVMIAILVAPLLAFDEVDQSLSVYMDTFQLMVNPSDCSIADRAAFDRQVVAYNEYMEDGYYKPVTLSVGIDVVGDFRKLPNRKDDISRVEEGCIEMVVDIGKKNEESAFFNIGLVMFVIILLLLFSMLLNATVTRLVVNPLERMFNSIQTNAKQMFEALGSMGIDPMEKEKKDDDEDEGDDGPDEDEEDELANMEAVVLKMSKLVAHVSGSGAQGSHIVDTLLDDNTVDDTAKDYIRNMADANAGSKSMNKVDREQLSRRLTKTYADQNGNMLNQVAAPAQISKNVDFDLLDSYEWNVFVLPDEEIFQYIIAMFDQLGLLEGGFVPAPQLMELLKHVRAEMPENPYHNFHHVIDVTHTVYRMICLTNMATDMTKLEKMSIMIGALCHDLGHPGSNNAFLVNTKHQLATRYNDTSVLENSHVSRLYSIIEEHPEADVFISIKDSQDWWEVRKMIIQCILCTDMAKHFEMVSKIEVFHELRGVAHDIDAPGSDGESIFKTKEERNLMLCLFMHAADISNPVKPLFLYENWVGRVMEEFFRQGDMEKAKGMQISPMMDRTITSTNLSQVNFIEFVVAPLYATTIKIFPQLYQMEANLCSNRAEYGGRYVSEVQQMTNKDAAWKEEECSKLEKRLSAFNTKHLPLGQMPMKAPRASTMTRSTVADLSHSKKSAIRK